MATYTQQLLLELLVKSDQFNKELKQVGTSTQEAEKSITSFKDTANKALSFAATAGLSVGVVGTIKKTTQAYGEFINQQATAQQVFGDSYGKLTVQMEDSVKAFGQSQTQFLKSTTLIAGLGKTVGITGDELVGFSTEINKLGADLAAAFNTSTVDAIAAIQSGFSGSSIEPLRKYNIVLSDTILKQEYTALSGQEVTGVLTQQQRMVAFLSKLYKESADYQGQWDRESDQFQGTMTRLSATMGDFAISVGQSFEPTITAAGNALIGLVRPAIQVNDSLGGFPVVIAAGSAALLALSGPLGTANVALSRFGKTVEIIGPQLGKGANAMRATRVALQEVNPLLVAAGAVMVAFAVNSAVATKRTEEVNDAIGALATNVNSLKDLETILADIRREGDKSYDWSEVWKGTIKATVDMKDAFKDFAEGNRAAADAMFLTASQSDASAALFQKYGLSVDDMSTALTEINAESEGFAEIQAQVNKLIAEGAGEVGRNEEAWDNLSDAFAGIAKDADDAKKAIEDLTDSAIEGFTDQLDVDVARAEAHEAIAEWIGTAFSKLEEGETLGQRNLTNLKNQQSSYEAVAGILDGMIAEQERATGMPLVGQDRIDFIQDFIDMAKTEFPELAGELDALAEDLGNVEVQITANSEEAQAAVEEFIGNSDLGQVGIDLLVDSGLGEEEVDRFVKAVGKDKFAEITAKAITTVAEDDIDGLKDTEHTADVLVEALVDEAESDITDVTDYDYVADALLVPEVDAFVTEVNRVRREAARPIYIPIFGGSGDDDESSLGRGPRSEVSGLVGEVTAAELAEGAVPTAQGETFAVQQPSSVRAVRAQQPIQNTTNVYVTVPNADPSATIRTIQRWARNNGALPIMRGH